MAIFFVTFDLNHEDGYDHYTAFVEDLTKMRAHRIMNNACLVNVGTSSPKTLLEHMRSFLEDTDRIFAAKIDTENSYYLHAYPGTNEWLEHNPLPGSVPAEPEKVKLDS